MEKNITREIKGIDIRKIKKAVPRRTLNPSEDTALGKVSNNFKGNSFNDKLNFKVEGKLLDKIKQGLKKKV